MQTLKYLLLIALTCLANAAFSQAANTVLEGCWQVFNGSGASPYVVRFQKKTSTPGVQSTYEVSLNRGAGWQTLGTETLAFERTQCRILENEHVFPGDANHIGYSVGFVAAAKNGTECSDGEFIDVSKLFYLGLTSWRTLSYTDRIATSEKNKVVCP